MRVSPQREAKRKKMNSEDGYGGAPLNRADVVPDCCSNEMQPIYRYKEEGIVRRIFQCNGCGHKEEVQIR